MIRTSKQLKDLVRNRTKGDSGKSQLLIRNYAMERFLERLSQSEYKNNFILKGGLLISSLVGLDNRAILDTTVRVQVLDAENMRHIVEEITAVDIDDNVKFHIKKISNIMDEADYSGVRISLDALLDTMRIPLKIDISTGDAITPAEITYQYKLMFEQRYISLLAYPIGTVLAEKIETVLSRTITNTRLRDYYDLYILQNTGKEIDTEVLAKALKITCIKRNSEAVLGEYKVILDEIEADETMQKLWINYQNKNNCAQGLKWKTALDAVRKLWFFL